MKGAAERRDLFQTLGKRSDESPVRRVRSAWISQPISAKLHSQTRMLDHREIPLSATFGVMSGPVSEKSSVCPEQDHEPSRLLASLKVGRDSRRPIASGRICATKKARQEIGGSTLHLRVTRRSGPQPLRSPDRQFARPRRASFPTARALPLGGIRPTETAYQTGLGVLNKHKCPRRSSDRRGHRRCRARHPDPHRLQGALISALLITQSMTDLWDFKREHWGNGCDLTSDTGETALPPIHPAQESSAPGPAGVEVRPCHPGGARRDPGRAVRAHGPAVRDAPPGHGRHDKSRTTDHPPVSLCATVPSLPSPS
jgi:hypothetical protein